jgi:hypothetical protein
MRVRQSHFGRRLGRVRSKVMPEYGGGSWSGSGHGLRVTSSLRSSADVQQFRATSREEKGYLQE